MKNYTYYNIGKTNLQIIDSRWLRKLGLNETRWILDREWFFVFYSNRQLIFNEWING